MTIFNVDLQSERKARHHAANGAIFEYKDCDAQGGFSLLLYRIAQRASLQNGTLDMGGLYGPRTLEYLYPKGRDDAGQ